MKKDIMAYVSSFMVRQKVKYNRGKQPGLLQPLPITDGPYKSISMDFVFGLPHSSQGNMGIWMIVDEFSKISSFHFDQKDYQSTPYGNPLYFHYF